MQRICECCGAISAVLPDLRTAPAFRCRCTEELFCRGCNHCEKHCKCIEAPLLDVPLTEQLAVAKHELRRLGLGVAG